jgi:endonuclease/exonuclease/phosphatase family metal-dependent hydrolase
MKKSILTRLFLLTGSAALAVAIFSWLSSCEPLATGFDDEEGAVYVNATNINPAPDTFSAIKVMTWNIRFGAARIPWFGDACGSRVILTEDEVYSSLKGITDKINEVKPDILLMQEVDLRSKRSDYIDELRYILDHSYFNYAVYGYQWKAQFIPSDGLGRLEEGNVIFSRWPVSDAVRIQLALRADQSSIERYFYERTCIVKAKVNIPGLNNLYALNVHTTAFATDNTKLDQINRFKSELDKINANGDLFVGGGDLNTLPPGSDTTDYCFQDACPGESFHQPGDNPLHKDGSNYEPERTWLESYYTDYKPAIPLSVYQKDQYRYFSHTTRGTHFWDRTLDHIFTNYHWKDNSGRVLQETTQLSDHAPVIATFIIPK